MKENHILIGLGGTGGKVLKALRKRLFEEFNEEERKALPISFLYVDSSNEMMQPGDVTWRIQGENAQFTPSEFLFIKGVDLNTVFASPKGFPGLQGVIGDPEIMKRTLGEVGAAAAQKRRAGRILFGTNVNAFKEALRKQYRDANTKSGASRTNIYIFTGLAGGTGSGAIVDVIAQTRMMPEFQRCLTPDGKAGTGIVVFAMMPEVTPPGTCDAGRYHANGFAALTELNALQIKQYHPYNTTGETERLNLNEVDKVADAVFVYSNINEHGKIVESHKVLPSLVSDFAYNRIFLEQNDNTQEYNRTFSLENINDNDKEWSELSRQEPYDVARSKRFSSFGIKRIMIPDQEIKEYFAYRFGMQALQQLRYNNWNDDLGFRDKPANIDFHSFVKEAEQWEKWRVTDKHLILDKPILENDKGKFRGIAEYWNAVVPQWTEQARDAKQSLAKLEELCQQGYDKMFRKSGVADFYEGKTAAREQHANEIIDIIESFMFDKWADGSYSLYNLLELADRLVEMFESRRKEFEGRVTKVNQVIEKQDQEKLRIENEWKDLGPISGLLKKANLLTGYSSCLSIKYIKRTELQGTEFALSLLGILINKMNALRKRIEIFVNTVCEAIDYNEAMIGSRCNDATMGNLSDNVIRFYDQQGVQSFVDSTITNKSRMKSVSDEFRSEVLKRIGTEHTFARANTAVSSEELAEIMATSMVESAVRIHNEILIEDSEKLINRSILEQLAEKYNNPDALAQFATDIIEKSGVYATFDESQINIAVKNNVPPIPGKTIYRRVVLVNLPSPEGNEQVQKFANKLRDALIGAVNADKHVYVDMNGTKQNEMTVCSITYCFPLRVIEPLKFFKQRYDLLVNSQTNSRENKIVLHGEGTGEQFPTLFCAKEKLPSEVRKEFGPYAILAYALGIIKKGPKNDGTGLEAFGTTEKNVLGFEILKPLADTFTDILYISAFTEEFGQNLKDTFEAAMRGDYLHVTKRQELIVAIQQLAQTVLLPECGGNVGSQKFLEFQDYAINAINLINNFK